MPPTQDVADPVIRSRADYPVLPGRDACAVTDWDRFVIDHRDPRNLRLHVLSATLYWVCFAIFLLHPGPWTLLALALSVSPAVMGHLLCGEGHPQLVPRFTVLFFATKLAWRVYRGKYHLDVERALHFFDPSTGRRRGLLSRASK